MKTIKEKVFGTVPVKAEVSIGVLIQIEDRFGGLKQCLSDVEEGRIWALRFCLRILIEAGGLEAEKASTRADEAIEEGGLNAVRQFLYAVFTHAIAKADIAQGEEEGKVDPTTSTPKPSTASASP